MAETKIAKTLSERLAERSSKKKVSRKAKNRAAFLAIRADIKSALDDGWSIYEIWELLAEEKKIDYSYQSFRNYTNKLILASPSKPIAPPEPTNKVEKNDNEGGKTEEKKPDKIQAFNFNPIPNKEELY